MLQEKLAEQLGALDDDMHLIDGVPVPFKPDSLNNNPPIWFAQTSNNQALDLSSICGFRSPNICNIELREASDKSSVLSDFCKKNQRCELTGTCNQQPASRASSNPQFEG